MGLSRNEARAEVRRLVEAGHPNDVISDKTGVPYTTVTRWVRERNWKPRSKLSPLAVRRLQLMAKQGWSCGTTARALGVDRKTVKKLAGDMGIEFATGAQPRALASSLKLAPMKRWKAKMERLSEKEERENPLDEWAWG